MYIQSLNAVESIELRNIFLMLRAELKELDIPHHTTIRTCVEEVVEEHLKQLQADMEVSQLFLFHTNQLNFSSDVHGFDFGNDGSLDNFKSHTIHGGNCALDPGDLQGDN